MLTKKCCFHRYGLAEMIFEPAMVEPLYIKLRCGTTVTPNGAKGFEMVRIPTDHLPGKFCFVFFYNCNPSFLTLHDNIVLF